MDWTHAQWNALRLTLAILLAYAVALALDWANPVWAAFSVFIPRLPYMGMTVRQSVRMMIGTFAGAAAGVAIVGLFAQDRWLALFWLVTWFGGCLFAAQRRRGHFAMLVAGFTAFVVFSYVIFEPQHTYLTAFYRIVEICLGILIGTVCGGLLWPDLEVPAIHRQLEAIRQETLRFQKTLAATLDGDRLALKQMPGMAHDLAKQFADTKDLIAAAYPKTFVLDKLKFSADLFLHGRNLATHLGALAELVRTYPQLMQGECSPWFSAWLRTCADALDHMDWQQKTVQGESPLAAASVHYLREIDAHLEEKLRAADTSVEGLTHAIAARDALVAITEIVDEIVNHLRRHDPHNIIPIERSEEIISALPPRSSVAGDAWRSLTGALGLFAAGALWFTIYTPSAAVVFQMAGIVQMWSIVFPRLAPRVLIGAFIMGQALAFFVLIFVMPALDGFVQLALAMFLPLYLFALLKQFPKVMLLGTGAFVAFTGLLMIQNQQPSFIDAPSSFITAAIAQLTGAAIGLAVLNALNPATAGQRFCNQLQIALERCGNSPTPSSNPEQIVRHAVDRREELQAANHAVDFWRIYAAREYPQLADSMLAMTHRLHVLTIALRALERSRDEHLDSLTSRGQIIAKGLRAAASSCIKELEDSATSLGPTIKVDNLGELRDRIDHAALSARALLDQRQTAVHIALSVLGNYHMVYAALRSLAAVEQLDCELLMRNRF